MGYKNQKNNRYENQKVFNALFLAASGEVQDHDQELLIVQNFFKKKSRDDSFQARFFCKFLPENQGEITGK